MKNKNLFQSLIYCALLLVACASIAPAQKSEAKQTKPVVMILGSYHMGNPGLDVNNIQADDVRSAKRQKELAELIIVLQRFRPTKIAIEVTPEKPAYLARYTEYLGGKYELAANEVDQIAFRLAKQSNHKQIYAIDWKNDFDFDKVMASAKENNQMPIMEEQMAYGKSETAKINEMQKTSTIAEILRYMNDEKRLEEMHAPYLKFAQVGAGKDFAGADLTAGWYERNLKIYANIVRLAESKDERILVLIGAGHAKLLRQYAAEGGDFELVRTNDYLK